MSGANLAVAFDAIAAGRPALEFQERALSGPALAEESRRVAGGLRAHGIERGDRVVVWMANAPAWLALLLACARLGAVVVAANNRLRPLEVAALIERTGARAVALGGDPRVGGPEALVEALDVEVRARLAVLVVGGDHPASRPRIVDGVTVVDYRALATASPIEGTTGGGGDSLLVFPTSGTTGAPRLVLHTHAGLLDHARAVAAAFGYGGAIQRSLLVLPLAGAFGLAQATTALLSGTTLVIEPAFDPERIARRLAHGGIGHLNATDDVLATVLDAAGEEARFPTLAWAGFAAFNREPAVLVAAAERRGMRLCGLWGSSEAQALFAWRSPDLPAEQRALAGGRPVSPRSAVRVRDPDGGGLLRPGQVGELEVRGPSLMAGYLGDPGSTAAVQAGDGFVRTGDLARLEADGGFTFLARTGDALRLSGFLVDPREIEAVLGTFPGVAQACVVAVPVAGKPRPGAALTLVEGSRIDREALVAFCRERMARFKVPARVVVLPALPVTEGPNGTKVRRGEVRRILLDTLEAGR